MGTLRIAEEDHALGDERFPCADLETLVDGVVSWYVHHVSRQSGDRVWRAEVEASIDDLSEELERSLDAAVDVAVERVVERLQTGRYRRKALRDLGEW